MYANSIRKKPGRKSYRNTRSSTKNCRKICDVKLVKAVGCLQLCTGKEAGSEAAIHGMHETLDNSKTEAILLVNAENAFKTINTKSNTSQYQISISRTSYVYLQLLRNTSNTIYHRWWIDQIVSRNNSARCNCHRNMLNIVSTSLRQSPKYQ